MMPLLLGFIDLAAHMIVHFVSYLAPGVS